MQISLKHLSVVLSLMSVTVEGALPLAPAETFGVSGLVTTNVAGPDVALCSAAHLDGRIVVAGFSGDGGSADMSLVRYLSDGSLDASFGNSGKVLLDLSGNGDRAADIEILPDDSLLIAGTLNNGSNEDIVVLKLGEDGSPDLSFGEDGRSTIQGGVSNDVCSQIKRQPDGSIVVAGSTWNTGGRWDILLARLTPSGRLDTGFGNGSGIAITDISNGSVDIVGPKGLALLPDGRILLCGSTAGKAFVARFHGNGHLDTGYGNRSGYSFLPIAPSGASAVSLAIEPDGRVLAGGDYHVPLGDGERGLFVTRLDPSGIPDTNFGEDGFGLVTLEDTIAVARQVLRKHDGYIVFGSEMLNGEAFHRTLLQFDPDGLRDTSLGEPDGIFRLPSPGIANFHASLIALPNDALLISGSSLVEFEKEIVLVKLAPLTLVETLAATEILDNAVTLNARVNPYGSETTAYFQYGATTDYGNTIRVTLTPDDGTESQFISQTVNDLEPGRPYHFRAISYSAFGLLAGEDRTFTTGGPAPAALELWRWEYFGSTANSGDGANDTDLDKDGFTNLAEWAMGLNPLSGDPAGTIRLVPDASGAVHFSYQVSRSALDAGAVIQVEWNDTLQPSGWRTTGVDIVETGNDATFLYQEATITATGRPSLFVRLRITSP